jgi:catechol 2,3-dioxygenase-like lactoylglutathione lyase family enzyme
MGRRWIGRAASRHDHRMHSLGISHFGMGVRDLERSKVFYRDVIGLDVVLELDYDEAPELLSRPQDRGRQAVYFRLGPEPGSPVITMGSIHPEDSTAGIMLDQLGIHHLAIWVDDLEALITRLDAVGVKPFWGPIYIYDYPVDVCDPDRKPADVASMFFRDPDGIMFQAEQRMSDNTHGYPEANLPKDAILPGN